MALIKCPECGKEVSDKASSCPNCGYPLTAVRPKNGTDTTENMKKKRTALIFSILMILIVFITVSLLIIVTKNKAEKLKPYKTVGTIVQFGAYPQTESGIDKTPIDWIVLDVQKNKTLLLSKYALDCQPYNAEWIDVTWEKCTLRAWLNDYFLKNAFSANEQSAILLTDVDNSRSQGYIRWDTNGGNNTQDKLFLLSYSEANKYLDETVDNNDNIKSRVAPTLYAIKQGADPSDKNNTSDGQAAVSWWLRSPHYTQSLAYYVQADDVLILSVDTPAAVRPAMWIDLESLVSTD